MLVEMSTAVTPTPAPMLTDYLADQLSVEVRPLDLNQLVRCEEPLDEALQARCLTAIGAALREGKL